MDLNIIHKIYSHSKIILTHKWYVFKYMFYLGMPVRGLLHDMSKFSPTEFIESVKFFQGDRSPIDAAKEKQGYSLAWLHHKGRNPHHYEYWIDYLDKGGVPQIIPFEYAAEMVCDYIAAGKTYAKDKWTESTPYDYWMEKKFDKAKIHPYLKDFFTDVFYQIKQEGLDDIMVYSTLKAIYSINVIWPGC